MLENRFMRNPAAALLLTLVACVTPGAAPRVSSQVGKPLVLSVPDLEGNVVDVAAERGKVRVIDFWATWCEPCKEELPALDGLHRELGSRGLSVYGISFDEDRALIPEFLAQVPVRFRVLWDRGGEQLSGRFEVARLPTTLIVDRRGVIRFVHEGWSDTRAAEQRRQVEQLLDER